MTSDCDIQNPMEESGNNSLSKQDKTNSSYPCECHCNYQWHFSWRPHLENFPVTYFFLFMVLCSLCWSPCLSIDPTSNVAPSSIKPSPASQLNPQPSQKALTAEQCASSKREWLSMRYMMPQFGRQTPLTAPVPAICRPAGAASCCTPQMETEMYSLSTLQVARIFSYALTRPMISMGNDSIALNYYYKSDIDRAKTGLHEMYSSTYGYNYKQNREFFVKFFVSLTDYMVGRRQNIALLLDTFFEELRDRIVRIMVNAKTASDIARAKCISEKLKVKKPFDSIPDHIKNRMLRSYPQARMYANGLALGREVLANLINKTRFAENCSRKHVSMKLCPLCLGMARVRPCHDLCTRVFSDCLQNYALIADPWMKFMDALDRVASRLESPFSFPNVNHPLKVHISSAIMNLQNLLAKEQVALSAECGGGRPAFAQPEKNNPFGLNPSKQRAKRQAAPELYEWQRPALLPQKKPGPPDSSQSQTDQVYDKLGPWSRRMKTKYQAYVKLFSEMSNQMCLDPINRYNTLTTSPCWNGTALGGYTASSVAPTHPVDPVVARERGRLVEMTRRLLETMADRDPDYMVLDDPNWDRLSALNPNLETPKSLPTEGGGGAPTDLEPEIPEGSGQGSDSKKPTLPITPDRLPSRPKPGGPSGSNTLEGSGSGPLPLPDAEVITPTTQPRRVPPQIPFIPDDEDLLPQPLPGGKVTPRPGRLDPTIEGSGNGAVRPDPNRKPFFPDNRPVLPDNRPDNKRLPFDSGSGDGRLNPLLPNRPLEGSGDRLPPTLPVQPDIGVDETLYGGWKGVPDRLWIPEHELDPVGVDPNYPVRPDPNFQMTTPRGGAVGRCPPSFIVGLIAAVLMLR